MNIINDNIIIKDDNLQLKTILKEDINSIAKVHLSAFPMSFFSKLGIEIVEKYYYWLLENDNNLYATMAQVGNKTVGFCIAGSSLKSLKYFLKRYKYKLILSILIRPQIILSKLIKKRIRLLLKNKIFNKNKETIEHSLENSFGILIICVLPEAQGKGIAQKLMEDSEKEALNKDFEQMHLSVHIDNIKAIKFYEKMGYLKIFRPDYQDYLMIKKIKLK